MHDFLSMGGYAAYIWPAWLIGVFILGGITFASIQRYQKYSAKLSELNASLTLTENGADNG